MTSESVEVLLAVLAAHLLTDFPLQSDETAASKRDWTILARHAGVAAAGAYLLAGLWSAWALPLYVFGAHAIIDAAKARWRGSELLGFCLDQAAHIAALACLPAVLSRLGQLQSPFWVDRFEGPMLAGYVLASGAILAIWVSGVAVGLAVEPFHQQVEEASKDAPRQGLAGAGRLIGQLERALIFMFVLAGQPAAIGFLIAAKSVFRFGEVSDPKNRKDAEYIIIGTLLSFALGTMVGFVTARMLRLLA